MVPRIQFTAHALARMSERGVSREQVLAVVTTPLRVLPAKGEREEIQGLIERVGRPMLLRVVLERGVVVTIITVIATSKINKYGAST
jgi:hypothetical protein